MLREKLEELKEKAEATIEHALEHVGLVQGIDGMIERAKHLIAEIEGVLVHIPAEAPMALVTAQIDSGAASADPVPVGAVVDSNAPAGESA